MKNDVAILIVTYNSSGQISECLRSVFGQRRNILQQVIVLDNDSQDDTVAIIRREFPDVKILEPGRNLGFAAGVNEAARQADAEFLLLLNPDTVIHDQAVERVVEFARAEPRHGLYGGRTVRPDGSLEPSSCWGLPTLWSHTMFALGLTTFAPRHPVFDPESLGAWKRDTIREVGMITGCFLLVPTEIWRALDGFDERYFMYGEDADLALRARAAGWRPVIFPNAVVMHEVGCSSARPIDKMMLLFRGKAQLARVRWKRPARDFALVLLAMGVWLRARIAAWRPGNIDHRWQQLWARRAEWLPGYSNVPKSISQPQSAQAIRQTV